MAEEQEPKLHIDTDWKSQAQAEKQKMAEQAKAAQEQQAQAGQGGEGGQAPEASFSTLLSMLASQALLAMGAVPDPQTGQTYQNLDVARHCIDLLGVLEEKTKGNLTEEESTTLSNTLYELRTHYVQMAQSARTK